MTSSIGSRWWRRALVALAALCATMSPAAAPAGSSWTADPEAQFLLDVNLHRLVLGNGVRAYQTPEGACVMLGDFLTTLDVPLKIDLGSGTAKGWAFDEKNKILIDRNAHVAEIKGKREAFAISDVRETPDGWCVDSQALARWFGMVVKADVYNSVLRLDTDSKLPVELAIARKARGEEVARKRNAAFSLASLPRMKLPYRMWRTPALEFVVNAGVRYGGKGSSLDIRRDANVYAAGEVAGMSYLASIAVNPNGLPKNIWARFYRSDPDGNLLGPLHATHFAAGDVPGLSSTFSSAGANGRGLVVTNRPLNQIGSFDRTEFRGRLQPGWDAELYRNGTLVAFDNDPEGKGEYVFSNIDVMVGDNDYEIILHGPQGQEQHVRDTLNVGQDSAPPGKLWYWAGVRQPGKDLLKIGNTAPTPSATDPPVAVSSGPEAIAQLQYGIDKRTAVSALVRSALIEDQRVTFVEGAVRRTIGDSVVELAALANSRHELAGRAQVLARIGSATLSASSMFSQGNGGLDTQGRILKTSNRIGLGLPLKLGHTRIPISASVGRNDFADGSRAYDGMVRIGTHIGPFDLASATTYERLQPADSKRPEEHLTTELIGTARIGGVRLRGTAEADILPIKRLTSLAVDAYWSRSENTEWDAGIRYDSVSKLTSARIAHVRRFDSMAVTFSGEAQSNGAISAGIRLSFSLDPALSGLRPTRERLASNGIVHARVFEDLNDNGSYDPGEPVEKKASITTGLKQSEQVTDDQGEVTVGGLSPYVPLAIGIDQSSLDNPALAPAKPLQVIVPRPGVAAMLDIALVGGGSIEGFAAKSDGTPYEGLDFDLVDKSGAVVATVRSDLDGYFVFENIRYGNFSLRLNGASASAIKASPLEPVSIVINHDKPAVRLGAIKVAALQ
ncbi:MAG: hypothetical protein QFB89_00385 [Pseudomonadota bacterium]|nr:hypothetical protein [Pseudomonadota bacterium]